MDIIRLQGEAPELYAMVTHLVMNKDVLASNNNYPFRTSAEHVWFIARDDNGETCGFAPVLLKDTKATVNNYYVKADDEKILCTLLDHLTKALQYDFSIMSVTQRRHIQAFTRSNFEVIFEWKRYVKMLYRPDEQKKRL